MFIFFCKIIQENGDLSTPKSVLNIIRCEKTVKHIFFYFPFAYHLIGLKFSAFGGNG